MMEEKKKIFRRRKFQSVLIRTDPKKNRIISVRDIRYKDVTVPAGYRSDGLSKLLNKYRPNSIRAALVHDYCCETKAIPRKRADRYFYEILRLDGVSWLTAKKYWLAVRVYATVTFKK